MKVYINSQSKSVNSTCNYIQVDFIVTNGTCLKVKYFVPLIRNLDYNLLLSVDCILI